MMEVLKYFGDSEYSIMMLGVLPKEEFVFTLKKLLIQSEHFQCG